MDLLKEYKTGQEAFYREDGALIRVRVLENCSDREYIRYELQVIETLRAPFHGMPSPKKFSFVKSRAFPDFPGNGELSDVADISAN